MPLTDFEHKLTWIFGSARTGSTWLLRMLIHPWTLNRDELGYGTPPKYEGSSSYPDVLPINESHLPRHLSRIVRETGILSAIDQEKIDKADDLPSMFSPKGADRAGFFFSRHFEDTWRPAVRALALGRFIAHAERAGHKLGVSDPVVLIKEPNGSFAADLTLELLPRSRMVFLIRDGRDVVDSQLAMVVPGGKHAEVKGEITGERERLEHVTMQAQRWVNNMKVCSKAFKRHEPERRIQVRYEDLRKEPQQSLAELTDFLGIRRSPDEIAEAVAAEDFSAVPEAKRGIGTGKRAATPGYWRESLSAREQERIEEIAGPTLLDLGYEV